MIGTFLLNRYELLENIGEGGMGTVYKAKCHVLNRFVAVKILKSELSNDEEFVSRFKREATSIAKLSHPNIVNVHDVCSENNVNFIVMEYVDGKTLKQIIKENGRLTSKKTLDIVFQIAKALQCAHTSGIIHRDIKPDNIMITKDEMVKVMDFGIAKVADARTVTNSNKVMGTAHYFSPEQAKGNFVDCRSDIYSLGIVMYEMVTGEVPYDAESVITIAMMHIQGPITAPKDVITNIPENINQVILRAMQKEPIKRYQTANEMSEVIGAIKENPNYKVIVNSEIDGATKIMDTVVVSNIRDDLTTVMSKEEIFDKTVFKKPLAEETILKKESEVIPIKKKISRNKKVIIIITSIILIISIVALGKSLANGNVIEDKASTNTKATVVKTIVPKVATKVQVIEKTFVTSLIGETQDSARQVAVSNGFLLGDITNNYSDSIDKGLVISQSPGVNTAYEKGGKISIVLSLGKKKVQATPPQIKVGKDTKKPKQIHEKGPKGNHSENK
ncbi:Stk1 family PASTA domain-containing Ser/Thr kinase [Clostridium estertheticum]|uniref:Stk1 family PASTA domain-containing Ser/Thr kinase n=1 Tax=Clostridium estertheticum TaxID=238834 RepID=UPI001CF527F2|nr:Stk1 family PASTA domain-containing Ser/Thr kinase [Clostridium estertheticum]MCB2305748.1 Stk1 family PASTA domain-containing Ser/Thr kinase [Clostridium estertheticum]MCB2347075.1 Stk1 family PASTA domain-containing Ser/Thr kinase [Clostridium estertheticum]MCB2348103.1 Stk1 family PASTA domain-containing Ser/Thr kinase [Clostridium estertheticum]WAG45743.1 Stk1 family PASTA domain-containing Ser/Thr kinase [Clostridium estertheticum]